MKKQYYMVEIALLLISLVVVSPSFSNQIISENDKAWAKKVIAEKGKISSQKVSPNSIAILYFNNKTNLTELDVLEKGLTLMLITDLSKIEDIQLLERVKIQAVMNELDLNPSEFISENSPSQMGQLLGVAHIIDGNILGDKFSKFHFKSNMLKVKNKKIFGQPEAHGMLIEELFIMEKMLLFNIIDYLKIELTEEEEVELRKPIADNLNALLYLFQAIEFSDRGEYLMAIDFYKKSLEQDPDLNLAQVGIFELHDLNLVVAKGRKQEPEAYSGSEERVPIKTILSTLVDEKEHDPEKLILPKGSIDLGVTMNLHARPKNIYLYEYVQANELEGMLVDRPGIKYELDYPSEDQESLKTGVFASSTPGTVLRSEVLNALKGDGFLAYAVQVEEDRLNKKVLNMHIQTVNDQITRIGINTAIQHADLRYRDAKLTEMADAQAGRVLKDVNGNWVRIQQYILRPDDNTVQLLNVCLRGSGAGNLAGLSTINWITRFTDPSPQDLRSQPWGEWLTTQNDEIGKYITNSSSELDNMSVTLSNNSEESLVETRSFYEKDGSIQRVNKEQLMVNQDTTYDFATAFSSDSKQYRINSQTDGFSYELNNNGDRFDINVSFFILGDSTTSENTGVNSTYGDSEFQDIWQAMGANEMTGSNIGENNLEIAIDTNGTFFSNPINVVYIPMSRMFWNGE